VACIHKSKPGQPSKVVVPIPIRQIGAGDVVKKVTTAFGMRTCGLCEQRRRWLNSKLVFGVRR
jgi:hypothetical protein